ncbi:hypothetical protein [Novosphingobium terrae]|uniref:hypothetical protein n=1 Tax=Novosphingobium terrae TaxID=2726189 RepID=UPI00197E816D|nr:hypothetical protein [Novosphingobium terrae]
MTAGPLVPVGASADQSRDLPVMLFARTFSGRPLVVGSEASLELRGGDRLGADRILAELDLDWEPEFMLSVQRACALQRVRGRRWFTMPAILLGGEVGAGRTHVARSLARAAGVPHISFDAGVDMFVQPRYGPDLQLPLPLCAAMVASGCANPVISILGIECASREMVDLVARLVDGASNAGFPDPTLAAVLDYSAVTWIVQAHDVDAVPPVLADRLNRVDLQGWQATQFELRSIDILAEVLADRAIPVPTGLDLDDLFKSVRSWRYLPTAELYRRIDVLVDAHASPF